MHALSFHLSPTNRLGSVGVLSVVWVAVWLAGCKPADVRSASTGFRDDLGRAVELDGTPRRIVSLSPATTEILFAIGAGARLVGRTQWDSVPAEAVSVPSVGDGMPPNVEAVAAVDPDLVVFYASEVNRRPIRQLDALGIQSVAVHIDLLERLPNVIRLLGDATGLSTPADSVAAAFEERLASARSASPHIDPVRAVILTWDNPPIVIGAGSFLHEMVVLAGAENVFADIAAPSAPVSIEVIAERDPDVFIVTSGTDIPAYASRPEWQTLRAIAQRRFAIVQGTEFQWPSIRSLDAVARLRTAIGAAVLRRERGS